MSRPSLRQFLTPLIALYFGVTCTVLAENAVDAVELTPLQRLQQQVNAQEAELETLRQILEGRETADASPPSSAERSEQIRLVTDGRAGDVDGIPIEDVLAEFRKQLDTTVRSGTSASQMKIVGRVHVDYWGYPGSTAGINAIETGDSTITPQDRLGFRRMRFGVRGNVAPNMEYRIEAEFAGGNNSEFRDAWLGFHDMSFLQTVLIGNQKRPYGLAHLNSSRFSLFIERAFVIEAFNQDARRLGIASYGVSNDLEWNWRYGVYNQRLIQDEGQHINDHLQAEIAGRLANTYLWEDDGRNHAHWAINGTMAHPDGSAPNDGLRDNEARFRHRPEARSVNRWLDTGRIDGADWYSVLGFESLVNFGPLQLCGEYQGLWLDRDAGFGDNVYLMGGYAYAAYFLTDDHMVWSRRAGTLGRMTPGENFFLAPDGEAGGWGAWQVVLRWSYADFSDQDVLGGVGEALTVGVNWYWNSNARVQFNYIDGRIADRSVNDSNGLTFTGGDYQIIGVRFMIDF